MAKRVKPITVRMSEEDYARFKREAERRWPGAVLTDASMILSFAKAGLAPPAKKVKRGEK